MPDLKWFSTEDEVTSRLAHYKYRDPDGAPELTHAGSREFVRDRVFPAIDRGYGTVYLLCPVGDMHLLPDRYMHHFGSRETELRQAGVNPRMGSWSVDTRHLELVVPAHV